VPPPRRRSRSLGAAGFRPRRKRYKKSPSFFTIHLGVKADVLPADTDVHHIIIEDWAKMEEARGTLFMSMPTL
jgi:prolycopene isomerase